LSCTILFSLLYSPLPPPPRSTLFPYTTLFRSSRANKSLRLPRECAWKKQWLSSRPCGGSDCAPRAFGSDRDRRSARRGSTRQGRDRKSTRLNSSHEWISYAVFCLKKKKKNTYM